MIWKRTLAAIVLAAIVAPLQSHSQEPARRDKKPPAAPATGASPAGGAPRASAATAAPNKDTDAIKKSAAAFTEAFNHGDAAAVAVLWTRDGEYVDDAGERFVGRDAIAKEYATFFKANPGAKITLAVDSVRQISDTAAIEDGRSLVEMPQGAGVARYTVVHVKSDGRWLMSSVRDGQAQAPVVPNQLGRLEWLVGDWSATQNGAKLEVRCRWIEDKKFLERTYAVKQGDKLVNSGRQIIGWNPQAERIQSWSFTSDGGHAVGVWEPHEEGWAAQMSGTLADGTPTESVNIVTPIDANAIAWSSTARAAGGAPIPDLEKVLLKRIDLKH